LPCARRPRPRQRSRHNLQRGHPEPLGTAVRKLLLVLFALPVLAVTPVALASPATIHPGTLGNDQHGNPLQLHGLGIVKVGNTYYGFGEDKVGENQKDTSFRAIACYSSTNLA